MARPRIIVTRALHQASELAGLLSTLGGDPVLLPSIELAPPCSFAPLDAALAHLSSFHWLLFTSANAVDVFARRLPAGITTTPPIAAVGQATARALERAGLHPQLLPPRAVAESLAEALQPFARQPDGTPTRFLLIRAEQARDILPDSLTAAGAEVTIAPAYSTIIPEAAQNSVRALFSADGEWPQAITFTSSSTARYFFELLAACGITTEDIGGKGIVLASIGPITSATLRELGLTPHVESPEASVTSLATALIAFLGSR